MKPIKCLKPYEGDGKYIFISYAHRDTDKVFPIIAYLQHSGYLVWYDEGIDPGNEWDESIAYHIQKASLMLAFISDNYLASDNCKDELNFARDEQIARVLIYLEDVKLPAGMRMRLGRQQAIYYCNYSEEEEFYNKLVSCGEMSNVDRVNIEKALPEACLDETEKPESVKIESDVPENEKTIEILDVPSDLVDNDSEKKNAIEALVRVLKKVSEKKKQKSETEQTNYFRFPDSGELTSMWEKVVEGLDEAPVPAQNKKLAKEEVFRKLCSAFILNSYEDYRKIYTRYSPVLMSKLKIPVSKRGRLMVTFDDTLFKSGKNGFAITEDGIYYKPSFMSAQFVPFSELKEPSYICIQNMFIRYIVPHLSINKDLLCFTMLSDNNERQRICDFIKELAIALNDENVI